MRRHSNRSGKITANPRRRKTGRNRRRFPAAGTSRGVVFVPGIASGAEGRGLGEVPLADLGRLGLADDDRPGPTQSPHQLGVGAAGGDLAAATERGGVAGEVDIVLDRNRHAEQRCARVALASQLRVSLIGGRVIARDLQILLLETRPPGGGVGWQGNLELPRDAPPPHRQRFYRLQTADGRSGQIVFLGSDETTGLPPAQIRFRTSGPFD